MKSINSMHRCILQSKSIDRSKQRQGKQTFRSIGAHARVLVPVCVCSSSACHHPCAGYRVFVAFYFFVVVPFLSHFCLCLFSGWDSAKPQKPKPQEAPLASVPHITPKWHAVDTPLRSPLSICALFVPLKSVHAPNATTKALSLSLPIFIHYSMFQWQWSTCQ